DLARRARIVPLPRAPFFDAFLASVDGPHRVAAGDTIRLKVSYGTAGKTAGDTARKGPGKGEGRKARLGVSLSGRRVASRDVARLFVLEVKPQPSVVLLASPPDWETRFLARTLEDVARVPVRTFIEAEPGGSRWWDAATLESRAQSDVARAVAGAALVIEAGDPATFSRFSPKIGRAHV